MTLLDELIESGKTGLHIGGDWVPASDGATIDVLRSRHRRGDRLGGVGERGRRHRRRRRGAQALPAWSAAPPRVRGEVLRRTFDLIMDREKDFAELIVRENGKAFVDAVAEVGTGPSSSAGSPRRRCATAARSTVRPRGTNG
jgi:succinate-semialdehyde dehydrogenase / glutarate-semialdehyde dehydrogenase